MTRWTLMYARDVVSYLTGLREQGKNLRDAIKNLRDGIPEDARKIQDEPETWEWPESRHWVTFVVDHDKAIISITEVSEIGEI